MSNSQASPGNTDPGFSLIMVASISLIDFFYPKKYGNHNSSKYLLTYLKEETRTSHLPLPQV
jgi:hypothetical protein